MGTGETGCEKRRPAYCVKNETGQGKSDNCFRANENGVGGSKEFLGKDGKIDE